MFLNLLAFIEHQRSPPLQALRKTQGVTGSQRCMRTRE